MLNAQHCHYRLLRSLGSGGMAQVAEAIATTPAGVERRVALKCALPELASDREIRRMFLHEARIASQLQHGNIVQVLDYGIVDDREMIVMEFVDGIDAARAVRSSGPMPEPLALYVVAETAHALQHVHQRQDGSGDALQIVHRDVSPHNIMLSWDGDVKLTDFGIALSAHRAAADRTRTGIVRGKSCYLAPEVWRGEQARSATDIYALGVTLQWLLGGKTPDDSESHSGEAWRGDSDSVSPAARTLIEACLEADPADRPSAAEVARRAGTLALQSLARDGRGALRDWLVRCEGESETRRGRGRLDDLMKVSLFGETGLECDVEAGSAGSGCDRDATVDPRSAEAGRVAHLSSVGRPQARQRWRAAKPAVAVASGVVVTALVGTLLVAVQPGSVVWSSTDEIEPVPNQHNLRGAASTRGSTDPDPGRAASTAPAPAPEAEPPRPEIQRDGEGAERARGDSKGRQPKRARVARAARGSIQPRKTALGHLRIGGRRLLNGLVYIDGERQRRQAPAIYRVGVGPRRLEVYDSGGHQLLASRQVRITAAHDRTAPLSLVLR